MIKVYVSKNFSWQWINLAIILEYLLILFYHLFFNTGNLSSHNGNGSGGINCSVRRITSEKGWGELELGAGNGLNIAFKGFRNFSRGVFGNGSVLTHFTPNGLRVGTVTSKYTN